VNPPLTLPVLHAVTNDEIINRPEFFDRAVEVMSATGPRGAIQLRAPRTDGAVLYEIAARLAEVQASTGAWVVVNDRVDVALAAGAHGAQLTGHSIELADALRIAGSLAVGVSIHDLEEGVAARLAGAAWGVVGHVLDAATVSARRQAEGGMALFRQLVRGTLPLVAIGGVVPQHVGPLRRMGAYGIAAIRGIWDAENAARAASDYLSHYDGDGVG
jgi:thiamine-phosphate diphosphorylase